MNDKVKKTTKAEDAEAKDQETEAAEDPIELLERFCSAAQTDRYRRNNGLMNLVRAYQIEQGAIKELQNRLDQRNERRGETNIAE